MSWIIIAMLLLLPNSCTVMRFRNVYLCMHKQLQSHAWCSWTSYVHTRTDCLPLGHTSFCKCKTVFQSRFIIIVIFLKIHCGLGHNYSYFVTSSHGYNLLLLRLLYLNNSAVISLSCRTYLVVQDIQYLLGTAFQKIRVCRTGWNNDVGIIVTDNTEISDYGISCFLHISSLGKWMFEGWEGPCFHGRPVECAGYIWCWWLSAALMNCVTWLQFTRQWN